MFDKGSLAGFGTLLPNDSDPANGNPVTYSAKQTSNVADSFEDPVTVAIAYRTPATLQDFPVGSVTVNQEIVRWNIWDSGEGCWPPIEDSQIGFSGEVWLVKVWTRTVRDNCYKVACVKVQD